MLYFAEDGLKKAQQVTAALYDGDFAALSSLTQAEMKSIFVGAKVHEILLEPGMTVLDLVLKAKIYKHDRTYTQHLVPEIKSMNKQALHLFKQVKRRDTFHKADSISIKTDAKILPK